MKSMVNRIIVAFLVMTLAGVAVFAKSKKASVVFTTDTRVNGTLVKSGHYDAVFDEQTTELSILKGSKVVAKTAARVEKRDAKSRSTETRVAREGNDTNLIGIAFGGSDQVVLVNQMGMQAGGN